MRTTSKGKKMKEEDVKYTGQELGQVLGNQFNSGEGSSSHAGTRGLPVGGVMLHCDGGTRLQK